MKWNGAKTIVYGSGRKSGVDNESFQQFHGEWLYGMFSENGATHKGRWNYQHTVQWNKPEQVVVYDINWTKSFNDFFLWSHKPLLDKSGINGTWWDNSSIFTIRQYNPQLKRMESQWGFYNRRDLTKRLNVLGWQLMRPPIWISNMHVNTSWSQIFWMVENEWYCSSPNITSFEHWQLDQFRAMSRNKSTCLITKPWFRGFTGTTSESKRTVKRSVFAMAIAHDIQDFTENRKRSELNDCHRKLNFLVNLSDTFNCKFTGYWNAKRYISNIPTELRVSIYSNRNTETAALLFFAPEKQAGSLTNISINISKLMGKKKITRLFDMENGRSIAYKNKDGKLIFSEDLKINAYDFKLIGIEL